MELHWHHYKYYPYERELALREINSLLMPSSVLDIKEGFRIEAPQNIPAIERLAYFSEAKDDDKSICTLQSKLERANGNGPNRQSTRYSVHGLHEYKGKFNPQMARAILNILRISEGSRVLDPFCGSGTSLVECAHMGMKATGTDINPLAIFIANAKLKALCLPASRLKDELHVVIKLFKSRSCDVLTLQKDERLKYLEKWFDTKILADIERLRNAISQIDVDCAPVMLVIASNLLREYSLQDPHDLRIRRRRSPLPEFPIIETFHQAAEAFLSRLVDTQITLEDRPKTGRALLIDSRWLHLGRHGMDRTKFDCALTSPPYATALPYIDTQRLSLVWLGLIPASQILPLESQLVGSREIRGSGKKSLVEDLKTNRVGLPVKQSTYCQMLQNNLSENDGFRRQAVPILLYRYFVGMAEAFSSVHSCMKKGAPYALIVGCNHTILGGKRFDIDTPMLLANLAESYGWTHVETIPLQTYRRYGYHMNNAVSSEYMIILRST